MLHSLPKPVVLILTFAFTIFVYAAAKWLFTRGGEPLQENGVEHYRLRPAARALSIALCALGLWALVSGLRSLKTPLDFLWAPELFGGLAMMLSGTFMFSARIALDEAGLHYRRGWKRMTSISWIELDHYEVLFNRSLGTSTYFFRARDGASIPVDETGYNIEALMQHIQARKKLREMPYTRRHWYGG
jgi:hypothetical protein